MAFVGSGYITVAEKLIELADPLLPQEIYDAYLRSAVSRFYYGVYIQISAYLSTNGLVRLEYKAIDHQNVLEALENAADPRLNSIGDKFKFLRASRDTADYGSSIPRISTFVDMQKRYTKQALDIINAL